MEQLLFNIEGKASWIKSKLSNYFIIIAVNTPATHSKQFKFEPLQTD